MFSVNVSAEVCSSDMKKKVFLPVEHIHDKMYFELKKTSKPLLRALFAGTDHATSYEQAGTQTNIIKQLRVLKDQAFFTELNQSRPKRARLGGPMAVKVLQLNETTVIAAPTVHHVSGMSISVVLNKPGKAFKVELSSAVLEYIRGCMLAQIEFDDIKAQHPRLARDPEDRVTIEAPGVSFSYTRNKFRVSRTPRTKGRTKVTSDRQTAIEFADGGAVSDMDNESNVEQDEAPQEATPDTSPQKP